MRSIELQEANFDKFIETAKKCNSVGDFYEYAEALKNG